MSSDTNIERRGFLLGVLRWLSIAGLAAMAFVLGRRGLLDKLDEQSDSGGQNCTGKSICARCGVNATCGLPQALSRRRAIAGEETTILHR